MATSKAHMVMMSGWSLPEALVCAAAAPRAPESEMHNSLHYVSVVQKGELPVHIFSQMVIMLCMLR